MKITPINTAISSIVGKNTLATISGIQLVEINQLIEVLATNPVIGGIPIFSAEIKCTRTAEISDIVLMSQTSGDKNHYTDNIALMPRQWRVVGYLKVLSPTIESLLTNKPTLGLQKALLNRYMESRQKLKFKDEAGDIHDVFIKDFDTVYSAQANNAYAITLILQEAAFLETLNTDENTALQYLTELEKNSVPKNAWNIVTTELCKAAITTGITDTVKLCRWLFNKMQAKLYQSLTKTESVEEDKPVDDLIREFDLTVLENSDVNKDNPIYTKVPTVADNLAKPLYTTYTVDTPLMTPIEDTETTAYVGYETTLNMNGLSLQLRAIFDTDEISDTYDHWVVTLSDVNGELPDRSLVLNRNTIYFENDDKYMLAFVAKDDIENKNLLANGTFLVMVGEGYGLDA